MSDNLEEAVNGLDKKDDFKNTRLKNLFSLPIMKVAYILICENGCRWGGGNGLWKWRTVDSKLRKGTVMVNH